MTDNKGIDHVGELELSPLVNTGKFKNKKVKIAQTAKSVKVNLDFDLHISAFMKKIGAHKMSGPVKITALIAYLAEGKADNPVKVADVKDQWNKMTRILGEYNAFYYTPAKENDWISPGKHGFYTVRSKGLEILTKKL